MNYPHFVSKIKGFLSLLFPILLSVIIIYVTLTLSMAKGFSMNTKVLGLIGCIGLIVATFANAQHARNYKGEGWIPPRPAPVVVSSASCTSCATVNDGCRSCYSIFGPPPCYSCSCTDPNCSSNPCMSSCRYCNAFGNVGDNDLGPPIYY